MTKACVTAVVNQQGALQLVIHILCGLYVASYALLFCPAVCTIKIVKGERINSALNKLSFPPFCVGDEQLHCHVAVAIIFLQARTAKNQGLVIKQWLNEGSTGNIFTNCNKH